MSSSPLPADFLEKALRKLHNDLTRPCKTDRPMRVLFLQNLFVTNLAKRSQVKRMRNKRPSESGGKMAVGETLPKKARYSEEESMEVDVEPRADEMETDSGEQTAGDELMDQD